jgi:hypothetical protein
MPAFFHSEQFENFLMQRMSGPEFAHFEARVGLLAVQAPALGLFHEDFQVSPKGRALRISYYYSDVLRQLFVVGGHL